jgi:hypothetical protein
MSKINQVFSNIGGGRHGGGRHGGGRHGGGGGRGRWGGGGGWWGSYPVYPYYYDYPYYDYPYNDLLVVEDGVIKKKKKKVVDTVSSADGTEQNPPPRPMKPSGSGKSSAGIGILRISRYIPSGVLGAIAGYFVAQSAGKNVIAGAVIGAGVIGGGMYAYDNLKK